MQMAADHVGGTIVIHYLMLPSSDLVFSDIHAGVRTRSLRMPYRSGFLQEIFDKHSADHDGAVFLQLFDKAGQFSPTILSARNQFPMLDGHRLVDQLRGRGTRHCSAFALSELTDAPIITVSEERGTVTYMRRGKIYEDVDIDFLKDQLRHMYRLSEKSVSLYSDVRKIWSNFLEKL